MAAILPYLASPGIISKILEKIIEAKRPDRFTQDFLGTVLGFRSGSAQVMIPMLKRLGFLNSDGTPTARYDSFRNKDTRARTMADSIRDAYEPLFKKNEFADHLSKEKLEALVTEITGAAKDNKVTKLIVSSFFQLKGFAVGAQDIQPQTTSTPVSAPQKTDKDHEAAAPTPQLVDSNVRLNLGYTINLNLPETTNVEVFNAIFKSLKENLLKG